MAQIVHHSNATDWKDTVATVMKKNEDEFRPSFSERGFEQEVENYVNEKKELLRAVEGGETVGILVFTRGSSRDAIEEYCPCLYINLVIVNQKYRDKGIGSKLYSYVKTEILPESDYSTIGVRTWEENKASKNCIKKAGFKKKAEEDGDYNHFFYYVYK